MASTTALLSLILLYLPFSPYNIDSVLNYSVLNHHHHHLKTTFTLGFVTQTIWIFSHAWLSIQRWLPFLLELPKQKHFLTYLFALFSPDLLFSCSISLTSQDLTITNWQMISQSKSLTPSNHSMCFSNYLVYFRTLTFCRHYKCSILSSPFKLAPLPGFTVSDNGKFSYLNHIWKIN